MVYRPSVLGFLFLGLAVTAMLIEVAGVLEYVREQHSSLAMGAASCFGAAVTPGLPALADWWWRRKLRRYWLFTWLALTIGLVVVIMATVQRTGYTTDVAQQDRERADRAKGIAERAEADALHDYTAAQKAALKECADARRKRCLEAEEKAAVARQTLATARSTLVNAPVAQSDALAKRLAVFLPVSEEQVRLIQPLFVPLLVSLLSALFFAGWSRLDFTEPGKPSNLTVGAQDVPRPSGGGIRPKAPPTPAVPASVAEFLADVLEGDPKGEVEVPVLYTTFKSWCQKKGRGLLEGPAFVNELNDVRQRVGIDIEARGKRVYCVGVRLAA